MKFSICNEIVLKRTESIKELKVELKRKLIAKIKIKQE